MFGTSPGQAYTNFTPSANPGSITTAFSVDSQNNLMWSNSAFYNNMARFCVLADNTIVAVFDDPLLAPRGCLFISLSMTRVSTCAAAIGAAQLSGPPGMGATTLIDSAHQADCSIQDPRALQVPQDRKEFREFREFKVIQEPLVSARATSLRQIITAHSSTKDPRVCKVLQARRVGIQDIRLSHQFVKLITRRRVAGRTRSNRLVVEHPSLLSSLRSHFNLGPQGIQGPSGPSGPSGPQGNQGPTG